MSPDTVNYESDSSDCSSIAAIPKPKSVSRQPSLREPVTNLSRQPSLKDPVTNLRAGQHPPDFSRRNLQRFRPTQSESTMKRIRTDSHLYDPVEDSESPKKKICTSALCTNASTQTASTNTSTSTQTDFGAPSQELETVAVLRHRLEELTEHPMNTADNLIASGKGNKTLKTEVNILQRHLLEDANKSDNAIECSKSEKQLEEDHTEEEKEEIGVDRLDEAVFGGPYIPYKNTNYYNQVCASYESELQRLATKLEMTEWELCLARIDNGA